MQSLKQLEETLDSLLKKKKKIVANDYGMVNPLESQPQTKEEDDDDEDCDEMDKVWEKIGKLKEDVQYLKDYMSDISNQLYRHKEGHIPSIESPSKMEKVLEILELSEDFEVMKKPIYAFKIEASKNLILVK